MGSLQAFLRLFQQQVVVAIDASGDFRIIFSSYRVRPKS
jgi:hypothetical protein